MMSQPLLFIFCHQTDLLASIVGGEQKEWINNHLIMANEMIDLKLTIKSQFKEFVEEINSRTNKT